MTTTRAMTWDERGLLPAVVQDAHTGAILMLAWMDREALERTRTTGFAHFYSRSRQTLWKKGESSGHTLAVRELRVDCDADAILVIAEPAGPTCHTGAASCFFRALPLDIAKAPDTAKASDTAEAPDFPEAPGPLGPPVAILARLEHVLRARRDHATEKPSYTRSLIDKGMPKILAKIAEEHKELAQELPDGERHAVVHETADLLFHVLVGLVARDIAFDEVWHELERRFGVSGHDEKASRGAPA